MRFRAGLHFVFTREVLEEIPTATLAIISLQVTSYSKKRGVWVRSGRCGWQEGEGSVKREGGKRGREGE